MYEKGEDFFSVWGRIRDRIDGYYSESAIPGLRQRMSNYWLDNRQWIQDFDDIPKDDLALLLFSEDFYSEERD